MNKFQVNDNQKNCVYKNRINKTDKKLSPGILNIIKSSYLSFDSIEDTTESTYSGVSFQ